MLQSAYEFFELLVIGQVPLEIGNFGDGNVSGVVAPVFPCLEFVIRAEPDRAAPVRGPAGAVELGEFAPLHALDRGESLEDVADFG